MRPVLLPVYRPLGAHVLPGAAKAIVRDMGRRSDLFRLLPDTTPLEAVPRGTILVAGVPTLEAAVNALPDIAAAPGIGDFLRGGGHLLMAGSGEGRAFSPTTAARLQRAIAAAGFLPQRLLLLQQSEALAAERAAWLAQDAHRLAPRVGVWHHHLNQTAHRFATVWEDAGRRAERLAALRAGVPPRRFACMVGKLRPHRAAILGRLERIAAGGSGLVSCLGGGKPSDITGRVRAADTQGAFAQRFASDLAAFAALAPRLPLRIEGDPGTDAVFDDHWLVYRRAGFVLVPETEMHDRLRRFTEKALKPLLCGRAALVAGNPGTLCHLRTLGFATFSPLIDESYDAILNPEDRLEAVLSEAERLISMPQTEWTRCWDASAEIGASNMAWAATGLMARLSAVLERLSDDLAAWSAGGVAEGLGAGTSMGASAIAAERPHS